MCREAQENGEAVIFEGGEEMLPGVLRAVDDRPGVGYRVVGTKFVNRSRKIA